MSMIQGWAKTVNILMSRLEDTMKMLGIPDHKLDDQEDPKRSQPEQHQHDLISLPGHDLTDQARARFRRMHASETLSKLRAQFQNVSCLCMRAMPGLHEPCLLLQRQPGLGGMPAIAMPLRS